MDWLPKKCQFTANVKFPNPDTFHHMMLLGDVCYRPCMCLHGAECAEMSSLWPPVRSGGHFLRRFVEVRAVLHSIACYLGDHHSGFLQRRILSYGGLNAHVGFPFIILWDSEPKEQVGLYWHSYYFPSVSRAVVARAEGDVGTSLNQSPVVVPLAMNTGVLWCKLRACWLLFLLKDFSCDEEAVWKRCGIRN